MYLVDANVLSEPTRLAPDIKVLGWLRRNERELAVDPIILGEIRFGIHLLPAVPLVADERVFRREIGAGNWRNGSKTVSPGSSACLGKLRPGNAGQDSSLTCESPAEHCPSRTA